jgi:transcriptional regulator with XRE-family HTH domain
MLTAKEIGKRAKAERKRANINQRDAAAKLGVEQGTISRWERGTTELTISQITRLAQVYRCSPYAILLDPPDEATALAQEAAL